MCRLLQHLVTLLSAPDAEVVAAALQALTAFLRKSHHQGPTRWPGSHVMRTRLAAMCRGWGGKEEVRPQRGVQWATPPKCDCMSDLVVHFLLQGLDLVSCVEEGDASIKQVSLCGCVVVPCTSNQWLSTLQMRMRCWRCSSGAASVPDGSQLHAHTWKSHSNSVTTVNNGVLCVPFRST